MLTRRNASAIVITELAEMRETEGGENDADIQAVLSKDKREKRRGALPSIRKTTVPIRMGRERARGRTALLEKRPIGR
mgnify:CR=1 FL=1